MYDSLIAENYRNLDYAQVYLETTGFIGNQKAQPGCLKITELIIELLSTPSGANVTNFACYVYDPELMTESLVYSGGTVTPIVIDLTYLFFGSILKQGAYFRIEGAYNHVVGNSQGELRIKLKGFILEPPI
jgi:hypothetical protein